MCDAPSDSEERDCYLKWNDYQGQFSDVVRQLQGEESMIDVTLAVGSERIHAHRIVLCACSSLFQELLGQVNEEHPVIILSDMSPQIIRLIVEYTYHGEIRVPTEHISLLLETAHLLKIVGLMDIRSLDDDESVQVKDSIQEDASLPRIEEEEEETKDLDLLDVSEEAYDDVGENSLQDPMSEDCDSLNKKKRKRRESVKREYSDDQLESAINMLKSGKTLVEASTRNNIPRSTLYMRAKSLGLQMHASRNEYPADCMKAAIQTVLSGSSLQHAAEMYQIPKTVLWRRIQKEGFRILRNDGSRKYDNDKRQAAVNALARGENLTKVSLKYQIPKTTLFRDKIKLIGEGKLPLSFLRKRKIDDDVTKKSRLEKAVLACKSGKMSQATASMTFQVPKTTIWRRLRQNKKMNDNSSLVTKTDKHTVVKPNDSDMNFEYCEVSSEIPITYIDENAIPGDSVIILTTDEVGSLNLDNRQIIVDQDTGQDYINCQMSLGDTTFDPNSGVKH